jgi:hypothetical protein
MAIDSDTVVEIDGGKVYFQAPGLNEWAFFTGFEGKNAAEIADMVLPRVVAVEGLKKEDGSDVTIETLRNKECSLTFFNQLFAKWVKVVTAATAGEAEGKNG